MTEFKISTLNIRGGRNQEKRLAIFEYLKSNQSDIYLLQECHALENETSIWKENWGVGNVYINPGTTRSAGQAILLRQNLDIVEHRIIVPGRIQALKLTIQNTIITILNVYGPNVESERDVFLNSLQTFLIDFEYGDQLYLGGDFNIALNCNLDRSPPQNRRCKSAETLTNMMSAFNLIDIWRYKYPKLKRYTWSQPNPYVKSRLDFFLIQKACLDLVTNIKIIEAIKTDHKLVMATIKFKNQERGRGFWKMNSSILNDPFYKIDIVQLIETIWDESEHILDLGVRFDWLKYKIMEYTREFCIQRAKINRKRNIEVQNELQRLDERICELQATGIELARYEELKSQLELYNEEKARGAWLRSRIEFIEKNEKSNTYFYNKSKITYEKKTVTHIEGNTGDNITNPSDILNELKSYYEKLYTSSEIPLSDIELNLNELNSLGSLNEDQKKLCEGDVTLDECYEALKNFKDNKSPGCDGLTGEFYKKYWEYIGPKLVDTLNYCRTQGKLTVSQRRGIITLLQKKGKDPSKLSSWRPVSLLCTDYKILTKTLYIRMAKHLNSVISHDQSGFIKGRHIGEGIRFIEDLIEYYDEKGLTGIILQLDFEKAFDSVERNFMIATLKKMNFGENFISWIKCCYNDIYSCVMNNGFSSTWFRLFRGMRQGCALSCLLFLVCVEVMACMIRENKDIKGLIIANNEHKLKQFADDCICTVQTPESVVILTGSIRRFSNISGLKLNITKSLLVYLGPWRHKKEKILDIEICYGSFNMLGIYIGRDSKTKDYRNFDLKIRKMENKFKLWEHRDLSICGRILLSKSQGISNLIYSMSMVETKSAFIQETQKRLNAFIWNSKPPKVSHNVLISDYEDMGLKSIDVESQCKALKMPWVGRILNSMGWADVINTYLEKVGGLRLLLQCDYDVKYLPFIPKFYMEMLKIFSDITGSRYRNQIIWNNRNLLIENKSFFFKDWHSKGILFIHDVYKDDGNCLSFVEFTEKFQIRTNFLKYFGVLSTIRNYIEKSPNLQNLNFSRRPVIDFGNDMYQFKNDIFFDVQNAKSKCFYRQIVESNIKPAVSMAKWYVNYGVSQEILKQSLLKTRNATRETKLLSFQFKVIHDIVNCKKNLFKWKIESNNICEFCDEAEIDNLVHALVECPMTNRILQELLNHIDPTDSFSSRLTVEDIIFGVDDPAINNLLMIFKYYISSVRGLKKQHSYNVLRKNIYLRILADMRQSNVRSFMLKWERFDFLVAECNSLLIT